MLKIKFKKTWLRLTSSHNHGARLQDYARQQEKFVKRYPNYSIGFASYGIPNVHDNNEGSTLKIGAYCSITNNVKIFLGGQHRTNWVSSYPFPFFFEMDACYKEQYAKGGSRGDVIVGSDVWLCANCTILSGVTIEHGAVIANGAVVSRNVEPYAVVAGSPACHIKWRFDEEVRHALLASEWWGWPQSEIIQILDKLMSDDLTAFLVYVDSRQPKP